MIARDARMSELARERGWDPDALTLTQFRDLALKVRPGIEKVRDVSRALTSVALTTFGIRCVPPAIAEANRAKCYACPTKMLYLTRPNDEPACRACQCAGRAFLRAKWADRREKCPHGHWDNTRIDPSKLVLVQIEGPP